MVEKADSSGCRSDFRMCNLPGRAFVLSLLIPMLKIQPVHYETMVGLPEKDLRKSLHTISRVEPRSARTFA